jgi:hypothetical protein
MPGFTAEKEKQSLAAQFFNGYIGNMGKSVFRVAVHINKSKIRLFIWATGRKPIHKPLPEAPIADKKIPLYL